MTEHPHTTEGDIECSCNPLVLRVGADGSISRIAGGPLEEPVDTGVDAAYRKGLAEPRGHGSDTPIAACNDPRHDEIESWYRQALEARAEEGGAERRPAPTTASQEHEQRPPAARFGEWTWLYDSYEAGTVFITDDPEDTQRPLFAQSFDERTARLIVDSHNAVVRDLLA